MDKNKLLAVCQYQFFLSKQISIILLLVLIANTALGIFIKNTSTVPQGNEFAGLVDFITLIFCIIIGAELFNNSFKFSLHNGVSRRTFCLSTTITITVLSLTWSLITVGFVVFSRLYASNVILFDSIYQDGTFSLFIWLIGITVFCMIISMTFAILMRILSKRNKIILVGVIITSVPVILIANHYIDGILENILRFKLLILGVNSDVANPYLSFIVFIIMSIIFLVINWFITKRIELK